jgi:hypothetical protein
MRPRWRVGRVGPDRLERSAVGPIAFIIVFLVVPLAVAVFAGAFFAAVGILRLLAAVPTAAWAALVVGVSAVVAVRLCLVLRTLRLRQTSR